MRDGNESGAGWASGRSWGFGQRATRALRAFWARARRRARLRRDLAKLDHRWPSDIGVRRDTLESEAARPFWRE
jgi:uncharacterized protein YjiS (DUF1127 family)